MFRAQGLGSRGLGFGVRVWGLWFSDQRLGSRAYVPKFRVEDLGFRLKS